MTLKRKILIRIYMLTFLIILAMSGTYYYLSTRDIRERSQQNITMTFTLILDDLSTKTRNVFPKIDQFVQTTLTKPMYTLQLLQSQSDLSEQASVVWYVKRVMTYFAAIAARMREFGALVEATEMLVYGQQRNLLAVYRQEGAVQTTGVYLAEVNNAFVLIAPDDRWYVALQTLADLPRRPLPEQLAAVYQDDIPAAPRVTLSTLDKLVTLQFIVPIVERGEVEGVCVIHIPISQKDVERYARLSGTQVNVFAGSALSVGTLPEDNSIPEAFTATRQRLDLLTSADFPPSAFSDRKVRDHSYYQGTLAIGDRDTLVGAMTVYYPRWLEEKQKRNFLLVMAGVTFIFSLLAAAEAFGLSGAIVQPITRLRRVMKEVETGNFEVVAPVASHDEIGQLAETFNLMTAQLKANFTKIEEQHRQVQHQNVELQRLDRLKDEFLSNTSHELRTPLNGIAGLTEALLSGADGPLNNQERQHVRMILQSSKRLAGLVNELLDFSKVKSEKVSLHIKPFPIPEVIDVVWTFSKELVNDKPIEFRVDIPDDLPEVYADIDRVEQILTNLVGNAIKFTHQGSITISAQQDGDVVKISVSDTGIGIPEEAFEWIFHPFEQANGSTTREFGGTGLGLAIAKELVELQGGKIWVTSEVGKGSAFHFTLPCRRIERRKTGKVFELSPVSPEEIRPADVVKPSEVLSPEITGKEIPPKPMVSGEGHTILIIDEDLMNTEVLRTQLFQKGFAVLEASNRKEAVEFINEQQVDLILYFAMRMRKHERLRDIPIVFVSAKDQKADIVGYYTDGIDSLTKPVTEELLSKVNAILNLRQDTQEKYVQPEAVRTYDTVYEIDYDKEEQYANIRQGNGERILVVDDEPINVEVFKTRLTQYNYQVLTASNGFEALEKIESERPDLVLLDLMMPKMSGFRVCQIIRNEKQLWNIPIIMLTAKSNIYDKLYGLNIGANDYIIKPFNIEELLTRIHVLLHITSLQKVLITQNAVLQTEIIERRQAEAAIQRLNEELEHRVAMRTADLQHSLETLKRTKMQLVQSEKMAALGAVIAGISHELNTPVGIGVTAASYLQEKTLKIQQFYASGHMKRSDLEEYFKMAEKSSGMILNNLQRMAKQIQNFKQASVGEQAYLARRSFQVKAYLEDTLHSLQPELSNTKHRITIMGDETITIESYPGAFSQIVTTLVMNSVTHAYQEGAQGHLCFDLIQEQDRLLITYTDDGCGIPVENLSKIFDPFFTTARGAGGSGLGLHIVYNLVTHHMKGSIHCESQVGMGTKFLLNLPLSFPDTAS
jgi:signal transduction histidine kinase